MKCPSCGSDLQSSKYKHSSDTLIQFGCNVSSMFCRFYTAEVFESTGKINYFLVLDSYKDDMSRLKDGFSLDGNTNIIAITHRIGGKSIKINVDDIHINLNDDNSIKSIYDQLTICVNNYIDNLNTLG